MVVEAKTQRAQLADKLEFGTFLWWLEVSVGFSNFAVTSYTYICSALLLSSADIVLGVHGSKLLETTQQYDYSKFHAKSVGSAVDVFLSQGCALQMFLMQFANIKQHEFVLKKWLDGSIRAREDTVDYGVFEVWGLLSARSLATVYKAHEFSWQSISNSKYICHDNFSLFFIQGEGESLITLNHPDTIPNLLRMMMLQLPDVASASEVADSFLPVDNIIFIDRVFEIWSASSSLGIFVCWAVFVLGNMQLATRHAHTVLQRYQNPIKRARALTILGALAAHKGS